jgi:hypothetical protein
MITSRSYPAKRELSSTMVFRFRQVAEDDRHTGALESGYPNGARCSPPALSGFTITVSDPASLKWGFSW